jgi:hypothetical protein
MKVLFVGRSANHFSYYESLIQPLCERGHIVKILFDKKWSENYPAGALEKFEKHDYKGFSWSYSRRRPRNFMRGMRELRSYAGYLLRPDQSIFYLNRWRRYLPSTIRMVADKSWARSVLVSRVMSRLFPWLESVHSADDKIVKYIRKISPDIVIVSPGNMRFDTEIEYLKAARSIGIPTAILVFSWDNLTTKGLFHVKPDLFLCWNQAHADEAVEIHGIPANRVLQIGSTFFDKWFQSDHLRLARIDFCKRADLDSTQPFFLYLGSSANIAVDETWLVEDIWRAMRSHPDSTVASSQLLVRPHPANAKNYSRLECLNGLVVWPKIGALPESDEAQSDFVNSVQHAVAAIGINTSGMIDNIILGRPCIALVVDRYSKTQNEAVHFGHLYNSGAMNIAKESADCVEKMANLLAGIDISSSKREGFVKTFVRPYGIQYAAGDLGATALELLGKSKEWDHSTNSKFKLSIRDLS